MMGDKQSVDAQLTFCHTLGTPGAVAQPPTSRSGASIVMTDPWRPNILFLLIDCLRADYVDARRLLVRTPNLLGLARGGLHASQMIAAATTTTPCVASILTGTYSLRHGIRSLRGYRLRSRLATLPTELQRLGYHTHAEVTGPLLPAVGLSRDLLHTRSAALTPI